MDTDNKYVRTLKDFLNGKASLQEIHFLLPHLDDFSHWENWTKEKWENAEDDIDSKVETKMLSEIRKSINQTRRVNFRNYWAIAASVLFLVFFTTTVFLFLENKKNKKFKNDLIVSVERGQKASVVLPDSTVVWINSGSELRYTADFNTHSRSVELTGEAFFNVAHHSESPFIVTSEDLNVTAYGTSFNVKAYPEDSFASVFLSKGKVKVSSNSGEIYLSPYQLASYDKSKKFIEKSTLEDALLVTAWMENKIVLENQSLLEITNILSRQYNVGFQFENDRLKDYRYSGTINNMSLQSILEMISLTSPVNYHVKNNRIVLSEKLNNTRRYNYNKKNIISK